MIKLEAHEPDSNRHSPGFRPELLYQLAYREQELTTQDSNLEPGP